MWNNDGHKNLNGCLTENITGLKTKRSALSGPPYKV